MDYGIVMDNDYVWDTIIANHWLYCVAILGNYMPEVHSTVCNVDNMTDTKLMC